MPSYSSVWAWQGSIPTFSEAIVRAREAGHDAIALEALAIADDKSHDTMMVGEGDNERETANTEWISRSKLRVETRLKLLAKWDPKRYGERLHTEHSGTVVIGLAERMRRLDEIDEDKE